MTKQIKGLLYFYINDIRYSFMIFWTILLAILVVTEIITYFLVNVEDAFMTLTLTGPMYVYCFILGYLAVKEIIQFSLKVGATRKNIFISMGLLFFIIAVFKSIVARILAVIVTTVNGQIGIDAHNFMLLHLAQFTDDTWYNRFIIDVSIMFFGLSLMFLIGLLFYRFGLAGGGSILGITFVLVLLGLATGTLVDFFINLAQSFDMMLFYQLFGISIIIYGLSFFLLRKITISKVK